ncbi:MAG: hypothetical protein COS68_02465 [Elusimicrobia bacterium CG06_land_8_20_14_3_00_38_11]|nr:MAG: hypothetical protein COS68_02465 [Elusimicrobia bacterium CG06_land_8_20_14_3_00_38_11]
MVKNITNLLKKTESNLIGNLIVKGSVVLGIKIAGISGLLVKDVKLSNKIQSEISKKAGAGGFISTDELPHYGITAGEKIAIEKEFSCSKKDVVVFVAAEKSKAEKAVELISEIMKNQKIPKKTVKTKVKKSVKKPSKTKKKIKKKK